MNDAPVNPPDFAALVDAYAWIFGWMFLIGVVGLIAIHLWDSYAENARERAVEAQRALRGPRSHVVVRPNTKNKTVIFDQTKENQ